MAREIERVAIPVHELRSLLRYYGRKTCVISGSPQNVDWHHLDDDPSRSTFVNLVPISRDFNLRLAQYSRDSNSGRGAALDPLLSPIGVGVAAERHLLLGHPHLAVGASRVGLFIVQLYLRGSLDATLNGAARTLHYARHAFDEHIIMDVLLRNVLQPLERPHRRIGVNVRVGLCMELGALLQDTGDVTMSSSIMDHALESLPAKGAKVQAEWMFELLWRRSRDFATMNDRVRADEFLERSSDWANGSPRQVSHVSRISALNNMSRCNWADALDTLEALRSGLVTRAGEPRPFSSTYWATASMLTDFATAMLRTHRNNYLKAVTTSLGDSAKLLYESRGGFSSRRLKGLRKAAVHAPTSVGTAIDRLPLLERRASASLKAVIRLVIRNLG